MSKQEIEQSGGYLLDSGLRDPDALPGTHLAKAFERMGPRAVWELLHRDKLPKGYFADDEARKHHLEYSELLSNLIFEDLLTRSGGPELRQILETNPHHGADHYRRVEKFYKLAHALDRKLRSDYYSLFFAPSAFISIRSHDYVEVYTDEKKSHDAAAALFVYAYLSQIYHTHIVGLTSTAESGPMSQTDWRKLTQATAFIIRHHSKPENMPSVRDLKNTGMVDPVRLLGETEAIAKIHGKTLYEYFPLFSLVSGTISSIRNGYMPVVEMSTNEMEGVIKQTRLVAAADKLDGTIPATLAATRTVLVRPERVFYRRMQEMSEEEEFRARIEDGSAHESACDFNRILFELTRTKTFEDLSTTVSYQFAEGLTARGEYFLKVIPAFLNGDIRPYLEGYAAHEQETIVSLLSKVGVNADRAGNLITIPDVENRNRAVRVTLKQYGYRPGVLNYLLEKIHSERQQVAQALVHKQQLLKHLRLTAPEKVKIMKFLHMAVQIQQDSLLRYPGPMQIPAAYEGYYIVNLEQWRMQP